MDFLYDWVKNLAVFMILISVIRNLLPKSNYEKYVRLFTGMLAVLLVMNPLFQLLGMQDSIDDLFSLDIYSQEMEEMKENFLQAGSGFESSLISSYEEQIRKQIQLLLREEGITAARIQFYVCTDETDERYGSISRMEIYLGKEAQKDTEFPEIETPTAGTETGFASGYKQIEREELAKKLCDYYHLERNQVRIYE